MTTHRGQESLYLGEETAPVRLPKRFHAAAKEHCYSLLIAEIRDEVSRLRGQLQLLREAQKRVKKGRVGGSQGETKAALVESPLRGQKSQGLQQASKPVQKRTGDRAKAKGFG